MNADDGGHDRRQTPSADAGRNARGRSVPEHSARAALLTDEQLAAEVLNVSVRTAAELMKQPWAPRPVMLGPRLKRHVRAEWEAAIANAPRQAVGQGEPAQLRRAKIERMKARGVAA